MKNQPFYRKILWNLSQKTSGFTLTELLVAIIITAVLITGTSVGLNTILQANARSEEETLRRQQGNRALNYISEDIRRADNIRIDQDEDWIFQLEIPGESDITYSLDDPEKDLLQQQVIYWEQNGIRNPLIDLITDREEDNLSDFCDNGTTSPDTLRGFYICLESGRQAEIVIRSELDNDDIIKVRTRAFARSRSN